MNENFETGYIFGAKVPKPVKDKGILWEPPCQVEVKCSPDLRTMCKPVLVLVLKEHFKTVLLLRQISMHT